MSALPIDVPLVEIPVPGSRRWQHVQPGTRVQPKRPSHAPVARPAARTRPGGRPLGVAAPSLQPVVQLPASGGLQLTRRGLAVVVGGFAALMMTALVVLVVSFLAVSNDPIVTSLTLG